jgi:hypothetical protein
MASTALGTLTERVKARLEAAAALEGVSILWGYPTGDDKARELVMVASGPDGDSGSSEREFRLLGQGKMEEDLTLPITVEVTQHGGTDTQTVYERSVTIAAAVETAIREDLTFSGLAWREPFHLSGWKGRYFRTDQARGHHVFLTLAGTARI